MYKPRKHLRNERGNFIAAQCIYIPYAGDVVTVEAMAMRNGMEFVNSLGFPRVEVESNSLQVINFCTGQTQ